VGKIKGCLSTGDVDDTDNTGGANDVDDEEENQG
jgi:hypothetical protein